MNQHPIDSSLYWCADGVNGVELERLFPPHKASGP